MSRRGAGKIWTVQWRLQPAHQVPCGVREGNGSSSQSRSICQQSWQVSTPHVCAVHTHSRKPFHVPLHVLPLLQQSMMSPMNLCVGRVIQKLCGVSHDGQGSDAQAISFDLPGSGLGCFS